MFRYPSSQIFFAVSLSLCIHIYIYGLRFGSLTDNVLSLLLLLLYINFIVFGDSIDNVRNNVGTYFVIGVLSSLPKSFDLCATNREI